MTCLGARSGSNNITSVYSANITDCVDQCATYNSGPDSCLGVFFDNSFRDGFENCYLLNVTGSQAAQQNSTYAERVSGNPSGSWSPVASTSSSSSSSKGSSSKAWIAGPVVGGIAAVAICFAGLFWWRRWRTVPDENEFAPVAQGSPKAMYQDMQEPPRYSVPEMDAAGQRHELAS